MDKNKILQSDLLDIIFDNRNKAYGAYDLRRNYRKNFFLALAGMSMLVVLFSLSAHLKENKKKSTPVYITNEIDLKQVAPVEDKTVVVLPPIEKIKAEPVKLKTTQFSTLKIVDDKMVKEVVKNQQELVNARIAAYTQDGMETSAVAPPVKLEGAGGDKFVNIAASVTAKKIEEDIFIDVQVKASYPGDWESFLRRNLNADLPVENGAPPGTYRVVVSFVVARDGKVSEVKAMNDPGFGTAQEAVKVIKESGNWNPGIQNNSKVSSRHKQAIVFVVE